MHFCQSFGVSKLLTGRENGSQKGNTGREFGFQNHYRTEIWFSNIITGQKFDSKIITGQKSSGNDV